MTLRNFGATTTMVVVWWLSLVVVPSSLAASSLQGASALLNPALVSTGLQNLGNTCYMNAQLQCAFHIPIIRQIVVMPTMEQEPTHPADTDDEEECTDDDGKASSPADSQDEPTTPLVQEEEVESDAKKALREVFSQMVQAADQTFAAPVAPRSFCRRLGIPVMVQQDSQEFWKLLLPAVNQESLSDLYKGSFEDYITALDGSGRERRREELFLDLSLDITNSGSTLLDSLRSGFGEPELLSVAEGNGWRPEKGADKVDAHKGSSLIAKGLPSILQFHLKRFDYDWQTDTMTKLNNRFSFPEELDLSSICKDINSEDDELRTQYDLQSILVHMGEYGVGHYYAYVRPNIRSDEWYRFNDDIVEQVSIKEVLEDVYGGKTSSAESSKKEGGGLFRRLQRIFQGGGGASYGWGGRTSNAYVVQYVRRCDRSMMYPEGDDS